MAWPCQLRYNPSAHGRSIDKQEKTKISKNWKISLSIKLSTHVLTVER